MNFFVPCNKCKELIKLRLETDDMFQIDILLVNLSS